MNPSPLPDIIEVDSLRGKMFQWNNQQEHPTSCFAKKLFYSGYFAGKIDPVLGVAGKMKYICWETFQENVLLNGHYGRKAAKIFLELWTIFENLLKSRMFVMKHT